MDLTVLKSTGPHIESDDIIKPPWHQIIFIEVQVGVGWVGITLHFVKPKGREDEEALSDHWTMRAYNLEG